MSYTKYIQELQDKLANRKMSVMIGSGFSKNISTHYPSWAELLQNLVIELHEKQLNREYSSLNSTLRKKSPLAKYHKDRSDEIIEQQGYLEVVSEFIRKKGVERMTTYIEEHIPLAQIENNKLVIKAKGISTELNINVLKLHREVMELPWNNIYTTNYDNLLELCVDEELYDQLQSEIESLDKEMEKLSDEVKCELNKLATLEATQQKSDTHLAGNFDREVNPQVANAAHNNSQEVIREIDRLKSLQELLREQIEQKKRSQANIFSVVTDAAKLRLKRNNNIIKLHGSLRSLKDRENHIFGFDGDNKKQYVICKEDYDSYPQIHEAFTQLMRISLLQESFCLIGFSANDPNFIAWVSWVRDILQKHNDQQKSQDVKIYLIDTSNDILPPDKLLFFENYAIKRIPIFDQELLKLIFQDKNVPLSPKKDQVLLNLFEYLGSDKKVKVNLQINDSSNQVEWESIWKKKFFKGMTQELDTENVNTALEIRKNFEKKFILPDISQIDNNGRESLLRAYSTTDHKLKIEHEVFELLSFALQDSLRPASYYLTNGMIRSLEDNQELQPLVAKSLSKNLLLTGKLNKKLDKFPSLEALRLAFAFKFAKLEQYLDKWNPSGNDILIKGGLLSFISPEKGFDYLIQQNDNSLFMPSETRLYLLELLRVAEMSISWKRNQRYSKRIKRYEELSTSSIRNKIKHILDQASLNSRQKISPYDKGRFSVSRNKVDELPDPSLGLDIIMICVETGFNFNIRATHNMDSRDWYPLFRSAFDYYPQVFLFYSLQIGDKEYIKRIAQDYCQAEAINIDERRQIAVHLFASVLEAPKFYQQKILQFLGTFINSVPPKVWEEKFMKLWRIFAEQKSVFMSSHTNNFYPLAIAALQAIEQHSNIEEIIIDCLTVTADQSLEKEYREITVDYSYHLNKNVHLRAISKNPTRFSTLNKHWDKLLKNLTLNDHQLFVIANLQHLLSDKNKKKLTNWLGTISYHSVGDTRKFDVAMSFLGKRPSAQQHLKTAILSSKLLWHTGYNGINEEYKRGSYSMSTPIQLSYLTKSELRNDGLQWSPEEVWELFEQLSKRLPEMRGFSKRKDPFFNYVDLAEEIKWFLDTYSIQLKVSDKFIKAKKFADELYISQTNYEQLIDGLLNNEQAQVIWALSELSKEYYLKRASENLLNIVLNRVLLQAEPGLEASISYTSHWVNHSNDIIATSANDKLLAMVLRKYRQHPLKNHDEAFVHECLIKIAEYLKGRKLSYDDIHWWIDQGKNSRYNNVRSQFTYSKSELDEE